VRQTDDVLVSGDKERIMVESATMTKGGPQQTNGTAADAFIETIMNWGIDTIFGLPGDGINGLMEALRKRQDKVRFVQVRHEEAAAFMACAYAKYTGKLGCCIAGSVRTQVAPL
jgi:glyoxylate carboligase